MLRIANVMALLERRPITVTVSRTHIVLALHYDLRLVLVSQSVIHFIFCSRRRTCNYNILLVLVRSVFCLYRCHVGLCAKRDAPDLVQLSRVMLPLCVVVVF